MVVITSRQCIDNPNANLPEKESVNAVAVNRVWTTASGRTSMAGRALDYLTFYLFAGWRLFRECRPGNVVIAKTDPPLLSVPCAWITAMRGGHLVNWLHDLFPEVAQRLGVKGTSGWAAAVLQALRNASLKSARINVVLGERMARVLSSEGIDRRKIRIIHNWCDGELVHPVPRNKNTLRKAWNLDKHFVVMYSGNLGRAHDFDTIIAAARILRPRTDIVFLIIGDGVRRPWLEQETTRRGLRNVLFKPYQPRELLAQSLSAAEAHLISLRPQLEGFIVPSKFYAVAAAGRPTLYIGARDGEIPRILAENKCGATIAEGDAQGLANQIVALAINSRTRAEKGKAARRVFEASFNKPIALAAWHDVINGVNGVNGVRLH